MVYEILQFKWNGTYKATAILIDKIEKYKLMTEESDGLVTGQ